ncbi:MAG: toll/interleukin-1 receptor domain-containing protein [Pseudohongiella sp.]|nr:toll/interleukin-1 receptor domain-containing protein [Pseudohongiella sp.]
MSRDEKTKVFVSYSSDDRSLVIPIVGLLRANGSFVFQDIDSIQPGKRWRNEIEKALAESDLVVVFWCHHANRSNEVSNEWKSAIMQGKDILPLLLDRTPLPPELRVFQWIDFIDVSGANHHLISSEILKSRYSRSNFFFSVFSIEFILWVLLPVTLLLLPVILVVGALVYFYPSYTIQIIVVISALVGCFILWARRRGISINKIQEFHSKLPVSIAHPDSDNVVQNYIAQKLEIEILRRVAMRRNNDTKFS